MRSRAVTIPACLVLTGFLAGCSGGGGGGGVGGGGGGFGSGGGSDPGGGGVLSQTQADEEVITYSTTDSEGGWGRVDLTHGGDPDSSAVLEVARRAFFAKLASLGGVDLDGDLADLSGGDGIPDFGFDSYTPGLSAGDSTSTASAEDVARLIFGANNLYDMFQVLTGPPKVALVTTPPMGFVFPGFDGGDIDFVFGGDVAGDGGPGLFSNIPGLAYPTLPMLPNSMGLAAPSGRGPSASDQHQFVQIEFPYPLDIASLFDTAKSGNSYLGDSAASAALNVFIEARWIQDSLADGINSTDQTSAHRVITGVAVIGGVAAVPTASMSTVLSTLNGATLASSNIPVGARARIMDPNVFTFIAHEAPTAITPFGLETEQGLIAFGGILVLPDPTVSLGGGRVFGGNVLVPGSVNDFAQAGDQTAAAIGFMSLRISHLRSGGTTIEDPYFHSFPFSQANVGIDDRALTGTFNRGPAIEIATGTSLPDIDILDLPRLAGPGTPVAPGPSDDAIGTYNPVPLNDSINTISTRPRFRINFDREVVPNSVGFSRHHSIHSATAGGLPKGVVFPFRGNVRPVSSPVGVFLPGALGSPLAPSIYVAVNQPAGINRGTTPMLGLPQKVNSPGIKATGNPLVFDSGAALSAAELSGNGLVPQIHNLSATLPRGVVPCDIRPLNQNNLQSYIVEPLIELPPGSIVTVGVAMPGLGWSASAFAATNRGNHTRAGTMFTPWQGLTPVGLGAETSLKQAILGNETIIKVNAGPMDLQGQLFYGGTNVSIDQKLNGSADDDLTTGGTNVCRTFKVGFDNVKKYVNAPVSPQALYLGFSGGGAGVLDLGGTGYNTNTPGGAALASIAGTQPAPNYLEVSRYLPAAVSSKLVGFNWVAGGQFAAGNHFQAFGITGRYTAGAVGTPPGLESDNAVGAAIRTGAGTPTDGINEGSSGYETLVSSGLTGGNPTTSSKILADFLAVGVVSDIEVGDFLDRIYYDEENPFAKPQYHRTYNTPQQGAISHNTIADPPVPNPPPLRFPVGLPHTWVIFDQANLSKPPVTIEGNEVFTADGFMIFDDGSGFAAGQRAPNGYIQLNPTSNTGGVEDETHLPNAGFASPFPGVGAAGSPAFVQTGPMPKSSTAGALILTTLNAAAIGSADSGGLRPPIYQSRQQIGNYLFVADDVNNRVHALNSNTMEVLHSVTLPDPVGLGLTPDLEQLFVTNHADNSVSIVDADPTSPTFMTETDRIAVGLGPRAVTVSPDNEDAFILNFLGNSISILDISNRIVRKTLNQNGILRPYDMACGMRESPVGPAFQSGTFHAFISNQDGNNVLIYQSGPSGQAGIGFDDILDGVRPNEPVDQGFKDMFKPRGITYYPNYVIDAGGFTVGAIAAHTDEDGRAIASAVIYTKDANPGQETFNTGTLLAGFGVAVFEVKQQFKSTLFGQGLDVALPDFNRDRLEDENWGSFYNLFNAGATVKNLPPIGRNSKYLLADNILPGFTEGPRWEPDRLYLSVGNNNRVIEVFDLNDSTHLRTITTPSDVKVLTSYFSQ